MKRLGWVLDTYIWLYATEEREERRRLKKKHKSIIFSWLGGQDIQILPKQPPPPLPSPPSAQEKIKSKTENAVSPNRLHVV